MKIELTNEQAETIALDWIKQQQDIPDGYKKILNVLFTGGTFAKWSWMDAIQYAARKASRAYNMPMHWIVDNLDRS